MSDAPGARRPDDFTLPAPPPTPPPAAFPKAVEQPSIVLVTYGEIDVDPLHNARSDMTRIDSLARSIYQHGLLENLVAREIPRAERDPSNGKWLRLRAGSRRMEAIRRLVEEGVRWRGELLLIEPSRKWPVLVCNSPGVWEHLVENVQREGVAPWDLGRRLSEIMDGGMSSRDVAEKVGRSSGWVLRYSTIGRGLAPETVQHVKAQGYELRVGQLYQAAHLKNEFGEPDAERQIAWIDSIKGRKRAPRKRLDPATLRAFRRRILHLRDQMPVPPVIRPVVTAVLDYLEGGEPPAFRALEERAFVDVARMSGPPADS